MILIDVYKRQNAEHILYSLLREREPHQCISHKVMPTYDEHCKFVRSAPYEVWYLIEFDNGQVIGSIYLTRQREIGIFLFKQFQGLSLGAKAIKLLQEAHPGRFLANVSPNNPGSSEFFQNLGFNLIQHTYEAT